MAKKPKAGAPDYAPEQQGQEIDFESFFHQCVAKGKLKAWQNREIAAFFFLDMKLRPKEDPKVYEAMLERY